MSMWSYCGQAKLCIFAEQTVLPDGWKLYDYFCEELEILIDLADNPEQVTNEEKA